MKKTTSIVALSAIFLGAISPTSSVFATTQSSTLKDSTSAITDKNTSEKLGTNSIITNAAVQPNIDWNGVWQKYNNNMQTAFIGGAFTGLGKLIDYKMGITPSSLEGDTVPKIDLTGLALTFNSSPGHFEDATIKNLSTNTEFIVPGNTIGIQATTATIPLSFNNIGALDTISVTAQTGWNGSTITPPTPQLIFEKKETMLTRVYYMDASTGEELSGTTFETLGSGMTEGDAVTATAKDLTANGWDYSGNYTLATPTSSIDGTGNSASTVLQSGDANNTTTTTGRQAIIFWYNKEDKTAVNVHDSTVYAVLNGDHWNPKSNFDSAIASDGTALDYDSFIAAGGAVDGSQVDIATPGVYSATYTLNGVTSTAQITVLENHLDLSGVNLERYVGDPIPDDSEFNVIGTDYDGSRLEVNIDKSQVDMSSPGKYPVHLSMDSIINPTFTFTHDIYVTVKAKQTAVNVHDSTIYVGDAWTAQDNFDSALDKDGNAVDFTQLTVDDSQVDTTTPGTYDVTYTYDGVTSTAKVTVKSKQTAVNVHDSTIYVGDAWTAEDNFDSALDKDGNAVDFTQLTVDDSQVDTTTSGTYDVTYTYDGVTSTAKVTVKSKQTAVNVHDSTIYVGDAWTAEDNFDSALDKDGNAVDFSQLTVDDSQMDTTTSGTYDVTYTYDGITSTAKVTVKAKQKPTPKPDKPTDNGKSEETKTDSKGNETKKDDSNRNILPETGEASGMIFSVIGILILSLVSIAILFKNKIKKS